MINYLIYSFRKTMIVLISEFIQSDIGHKYRWCTGILEIFGSWNNWSYGTQLNLSVKSGKFFVFGEIDIPPGIHEYKYKFTGRCSFGITDHWFHDNSGRMIYNNNQILDNRKYNYATYIRSFLRVPLNEADSINLISNKTYIKHYNQSYISRYTPYLDNIDILFPFLKELIQNIYIINSQKNIRDMILNIKKQFVFIDPLKDMSLYRDGRYYNIKGRRYSDPDIYNVQIKYQYNGINHAFDPIKEINIAFDPIKEINIVIRKSLNKPLFRDIFPEEVIGLINNFI